MTTAQFIDGVMTGLGVSGENARAFFVGLASAEGTKARNNPFATSRALGRGETKFNAHGVKNYQTAQDGIDATVATFKLAYYKQVRRLLRANAPVAETARALSASPYVGGSQATRDKHAANIARNAKNVSYESPALSGNTEVLSVSAARRPTDQILASAALQGVKYTSLGGVQDHQARPLGNWQSDNAFDLGVPVGTPVYATESGTVGPQVGIMSSRPNDGKRLTLNGQGNNYWYGHLSDIVVKPGETVQAGQLLGYSGKSQNGVAHLHIGVENLSAVSSLEAPAPQGGGTPLDGGAMETEQPLFAFEDPALQNPFAEPGSADIPVPGRNYAETWKEIGGQPFADPLSKEYGSLVV